MSRGRDGPQTVFERMDGLGMWGKPPESFGYGAKPFPKRAQVPSAAYQEAICHVANPESSCGQADSACGQPLFRLWTALRVGVNTLLS